MPWVFLAVSLVGAVLVVNAFFPVKKEPLNVVSFAFGWVVGELPVQVAVAEVVSVAWLGADGAFGAWPGWLGLGVASLSWAGLARLTFVARGAKVVVDESLARTTFGPVDPEGFDPAPAWNYWWRLAIAIPFRWPAIRRITNIDYWGDGIHRHRLDILQRRSGPPEAGPVLVYIHGGAWVTGEKRQQGIPLMHELTERGWVCVSINYRLSPRATWPAQIVDCKRAVGWVREHIAEYGGDPAFIAVSGGSAGAHLATLLALTPGERAWQPGFEDADTSVDACVPSYGVFDMTGDPESSGQFGPGLTELLERRVMKASIVDRRELFEEASPQFRAGDAAPPMLVLHGVNDTLVPVAVARRFVRHLGDVSPSPVAYIELPRAQHAFDVLASIRCRHTTLGVVRFLEGMRELVGR